MDEKIRDKMLRLMRIVKEMINIDDKPVEYQKEFLSKMQKQIYINRIADVDYMCYYLKISYSEFWERFINWDGEDGV